MVVAAGEILDGKQPPGSIGGDSTSEILRDARYDDDIKAIVLRVDSPGGSVFASEQIYREVKALRAAGKPVIVSMGSVAASGGYYISAGADEIWASPTTITGSIGVVAAIPTFQRTLQKVGAHVDGVGTTTLSGDFRLDRPLGPAARDVLQSGVEHAYSVFLDHVADGRGKTPCRNRCRRAGARLVGQATRARTGSSISLAILIRRSRQPRSAPSWAMISSQSSSSPR